jgi:hypothetical protein
MPHTRKKRRLPPAPLKCALFPKKSTSSSTDPTEDQLSDAAWRVRDARPGDGLSAASARYIQVAVTRNGALTGDKGFIYRGALG